MEPYTDAITMNEFQLKLYKIFLDNPMDIFAPFQLKKLLAGHDYVTGGLAGSERENLEWLCYLGAVIEEPYYGHKVYRLGKPVNYKLFTYSWEWGNPLNIYEEKYVNGELVEKKKYEGEFLNEL